MSKTLQGENWQIMNPEPMWGFVNKMVCTILVNLSSAAHMKGADNLAEQGYFYNL